MLQDRDGQLFTNHISFLLLLFLGISRFALVEKLFLGVYLHFLALDGKFIIRAAPS